MGRKFILDERLSMDAQNDWLYKLIGFSFVVEYKTGVDNSWPMGSLVVKTLFAPTTPSLLFQSGLTE